MSKSGGYEAAFVSLLWIICFFVGPKYIDLARGFAIGFCFYLLIWLPIVSFLGRDGNERRN